MQPKLIKSGLKEKPGRQENVRGLREL